MKKRKDFFLDEYAEILREHGDNYSNFIVGLANIVQEMALTFAVQQTALRFIYANLGHEFEFPKLDEPKDTRYGIKTTCSPKEGDDTKWVIRLEVEFADEEVEDD